MNNMNKQERDHKIIVEVCAGSYDDCIAASKGKADRVELNSALSVGGLTPTEAVLKRVKKDTDLCVICMVRDRAAGFCYPESEKEIMFEQAKALLDAGADGLAFGFLNANGEIDRDSTKEMIDLIHSYQSKREAVFHRAFDVTPDMEKALEVLIELGADRILTSGGKAKAEQGIEMIARLNQLADGRIELLAGSGVNALNANKIMDETGIYQVHSSCKDYLTDPTTEGNDVTYAYLPAPHSSEYDVVSMEKVKELVEAVKQMLFESL